MFGRLTRGTVASATLLVAAAASFSPLVTHANAALVSTIPSHYFTVVDSGGVNDENGGSQLELTQMGRDDTDASFYQLFWSWDATDFTSQTGDACALFDSDGDGKVDYNVCAQVQNGSTSGTIVQTNASPTAHSCDNKWTDRCGNPQDVTPGAGQLVAGPIEDLSNTGGNLVTATDPFAGQNGAADSPNDSTIAAKISKSLLPSGAQLVNVCDYESIANGGNNNPNDCIVNPGGGFLSIVKDTTGGDGTFDFTVGDADNSPTSLDRPVTTSSGTGTADPASLIIGSKAAVTETVPSGWLLSGAACKLQGGDSTGTYDSATNKVTGISIESGSITTCTFHDAKADPELTLDKTTTSTGYSAPGDELDYSYLLTNSGNVTLDKPYTVSDDVIDGAGGSVSCPDTPDSLAPGDSVTCTASYDVVQSDIDAGSVHNTATATAQYNGDDVTSNQDDVTIDADTNPGLTLDKSSTDTGYSAPGDVLTYKYALTNSGNVTLSAPYTVDDDVVNGAGGTVDCPSTPATLAPGDEVDCSATYTVTQADVDNGSVYNTATGHATLGDGTVDSNPDSVQIDAQQDAALGLVKTADDQSYDHVGQTLHYTYTLTNTGNVTLSKPYAVNDDLITDPASIDCSAGPDTLAPGDHFDCTGTYQVTQADLDNGSVTNIATATATWVESTVTSNQDSATVPAAQSPSLGLVKSVDKSSVDYGGTLTYTLVATNTGNVTLAGVVVKDAIPAGTTYVDGSASPAAIASFGSGSVSWAVGTLAPGESSSALTFQVTVDKPAFDPTVGLPVEVIKNVGVVSSDLVEPTTSNRVRTPVVAVLGEKVVRRPPPPTLPFTGAALEPAGATVVAALLIGLGILLTSRRRRPTS
jgi:uncharacterized repeat protein (TIGR01451 family)